jgi:hypothetical protein
MNYEEILSAFARIRPSSTFLILNGYKSKSGEVTNRTISFHVSYTSALQRSIAGLESMGVLFGIEEVARQELLASYSKSLASGSAAIEYPYSAVYSEGKPIIGVKAHRETQTVYLYGMQIADKKRVLVPADYPAKDTRAAKTIAKNRLSAQLPVSKWRTFILSPETIREIRVEKMRLSFEE